MTRRALARALVEPRWPSGGRIVDLDEQVLAMRVLAVLPPVILLPDTTRSRAKRPVRRRPRT